MVSNAYWNASHGNLSFSSAIIRVGASMGQATPIILAKVIYESFGNSLFAMWSILQSVTIIGGIASLIYVLLFNKYVYYEKIVKGDDKDDDSQIEICSTSKNKVVPIDDLISEKKNVELPSDPNKVIRSIQKKRGIVPTYIIPDIKIAVVKKLNILQWVLLIYSVMNII